MGKSLFIAEKPSVAQEFMKSLGENPSKKDGYAESEDAVFTWCVGHLVTMSYPECYDAALKRWSMETIPFIPKDWKYEIIPAVAKQFKIVAGLLNRDDVDTIYVCTDSGREGEYIYRLVEQMAGVKGKTRKRVWIDSQTEEEIKRGVREAKDLSEYDSLSDAAYLRAKEDYLMGINFSRVLTLKYGRTISQYMGAEKNTVVAVGRVMTCVLGMIVRREMEIRKFEETPFYRVLADVGLTEGAKDFEAEWKAVEGSQYFGTPALYKENGFKKEEDARTLIDKLTANPPLTMELQGIERKTENKAAPLLYNLAELQNDCSKFFKLSPDETLKHTQELYEKKLVTYPRTDARVLSTAVAKVIDKNIAGLRNLPAYKAFAEEILANKAYEGLARTRYVNDKQITDHYAIVPTGQGFGNLNGLSQTTKNVYYAIVRRFLSIFYPAAVYKKVSLLLTREGECFTANFKVLEKEGYLKVADSWKKNAAKKEAEEPENAEQAGGENENEVKVDEQFLERLKTLKKGDILSVREFRVKEGKTSPPKRYNSGSMILAMENAGQLIEDEELRAQIKGSGIGTSATRAEILKKLVDKKYIRLNAKTQIISPALLGEMIYAVTYLSIPQLLDPQLTASWEKGLTGVADGNITTDDYMGKLSGFITRRTEQVKTLNNQASIGRYYDYSCQYYK